ncbi:MAG: hypothetical protein AAAB23_18795, partial [Pseudomonas sp.]
RTQIVCSPKIPGGSGLAREEASTVTTTLRPLNKHCLNDTLFHVDPEVDNETLLAATQRGQASRCCIEPAAWFSWSDTFDINFLVG